MSKGRLGIMGFGEVGRHIYRLSAEEDMFEVVAISDYGRPDILHYLLEVETKRKFNATLSPWSRDRAGPSRQAKTSPFLTSSPSLA